MPIYESNVRVTFLHTHPASYGLQLLEENKMNWIYIINIALMSSEYPVHLSFLAVSMVASPRNDESGPTSHHLKVAQLVEADVHLE